MTAGQGLRTAQVGYTDADGVRQQFTGYEHDAETGLEYANARYYSNLTGRFTSVDPLASSATAANPQTFNRYAYVGNTPVNAVDPSGILGLTAATRRRRSGAHIFE